MILSKKQMSEEDIKLQYITPAVTAKWDIRKVTMETQITDGKINLKGNFVFREKPKRADYILYLNANNPIAVIEAKDNNHSVSHGLQQAMMYAQMLDLPFAYSSNGDGFAEHDFLTGEMREFGLDGFPTEDELIERYKIESGITQAQEEILAQPYYSSQNTYPPRYYQRIAVNRTVDAIARGQDRLLLVMATGTGKTYTAFQIVYRLLESGMKRKILYLADRNILVDQSISQDFKPLEKVIHKINVAKDNMTTITSHQVYFSLYQQLVGDDDKEHFSELFSPDFFDLIIVDECHRGSAKEESRWRRILEYFSSATQIGMTATPKETKYISNINYFGEPVYTYSLKRGIEDGFLAPFKVIGITTDIGDRWRPRRGQRDINGEFAALGANVNAFTSYDMTAYYFSTTENFEGCLKLLLEFVSTPYFTEESVEKERGIIDQEIGMNLDSPDSRIFDSLMESMYDKHPIRVPILGTSETIREITPEVLYNCHRAFYTPDNMLLCVIGDVEPENVTAIAREILGTGHKAAGVKLRSWEEPMTCVAEEVTANMEVAMPMFNLAFKCEPLGTGGRHEYFYYCAERETTCFETTGTAITADGRQLSFNISLEMSRSFTEMASEQIDFGQPRLCDPLVINLNTNVASVSDQKFFFDINADGTKEEISMLDAASGYLALDKNEDGTINDGSELFGTTSGNGFKDLLAHDEDGNGWIDEADSIFQKLKVWSMNADGTSTLIDLKEAGVGAIYLGYENTEFSLKDAENKTNAVIQKTGLFLYEDGDVGTVQQMDLAV